jgi:hypothetical protein
MVAADWGWDDPPPDPCEIARKRTLAEQEAARLARIPRSIRETPREVVERWGRMRCSLEWDGHGIACNGYAALHEFRGHFWSFSLEEWQGPFETFEEALDKPFYVFGPVEVSVEIVGMSQARFAARMEIDAPPGHEVTINDTVWVVARDGHLRRKR